MQSKPEINQDHRGSLYEAFKLENDGQVFVITILPNKTRGNHYHKRKIEKFLVVFGSAQIANRNRETEAVDYFNVKAENPETITITPNNTHSITASEEGCILVCWVSEQFDESDPDTFAEEV